MIFLLLSFVMITVNSLQAANQTEGLKLILSNAALISCVDDKDIKRYLKDVLISSLKDALISSLKEKYPAEFPERGCSEFLGLFRCDFQCSEFGTSLCHAAQQENLDKDVEKIFNQERKNIEEIRKMRGNIEYGCPRLNALRRGSECFPLIRKLNGKF